MENEDRAVVDVEPGERSADGVDRSDGVAGGSGRCRRRLLEEVIGRDFADRYPPPAALEVPARIDDDPAEPGVELVDVTQARKLAPGQEAGVLDNVASVRFVSQDRHREPE